MATWQIPRKENGLKRRKRSDRSQVSSNKNVTLGRTHVLSRKKNYLQRCRWPRQWLPWSLWMQVWYSCFGTGKDAAAAAAAAVVLLHWVTIVKSEKRKIFFFFFGKIEHSNITNYFSNSNPEGFKMSPLLCHCLKQFEFSRLRFTLKSGGQSDIVWCYWGLKWMPLKKFWFKPNVSRLLFSVFIKGNLKLVHDAFQYYKLRNYRLFLLMRCR